MMHEDRGQDTGGHWEHTHILSATQPIPDLKFGAPPPRPRSLGQVPILSLCPHTAVYLICVPMK